jgi:hypothetical protein
MKKLILCLMTAFMLLSILTVQVRASSEPLPVMTEPVAAVVPAEAQALLSRLDEIKAMDMSALGKTEKKQLRKEVRAIKSELKAVGGGVYLSAGAIIIIILLLILLL